jgi:hypothetical protein
MKKIVALALVALLSTSAFAVIKCESDRRGGMCCWDTDKDGPWKPISC